MPFGWFKKPKPQRPPNDVYAEMRSLVFSVNPSEIGVMPSSSLPSVWGVMMETGYPNANVTLVALADRTTSLYFSNGGGIIGAGEHELVAHATGELIAMAQQYHGQMNLTKTFPMPDVGRVRFYLLTFAGAVTAEADEQDLGNNRHKFSPLFHMAHEVIGSIRVCTERDSK